MSNLNSAVVNEARNTLENAKSIVVAIGENPSLDSTAAALALYLSLSASGKQVSVVSPMPMTVKYNKLVAVDKISSRLNMGDGRNLIISFPYQEGSIEKVSYNIENETFNLVIEPREGYPTITPEMMQYNYSGGTGADCVITIGITNLNELSNLYQENQSLFEQKPFVAIGYQNSNLGKINLFDPSVSSNSELILDIITQMGLTLESDIASNLLSGLTDETNNFSSEKTSATTFEAAAILLKNGAKKTESAKFEEISPLPPKFPQGRVQQPSSRPSPFSFGKGAAASRTPSPAPFRIKPQVNQPTRQQAKTSTPPPSHPLTREAGAPPDAPPDWLKPKIYKGSTLI